ncbi:LysR family transcriptional regulator [Jannaschia sp. CCS1]|uniref:LysR family transcriptional regulator n=1 Tax=Jannaschia sp. (strain CCS1) TaxID=290400 RepID=UPI000053D4AC|nr:LysR family transcriptional regulator [Jannaschia sp. CCS1]ABD56321.1 transcriptional regulator, LysR family [Jannaschia sp. CCS1]
MALSLKAMTYFTTALRHGNIARAAAELNIAASAVSTAIDQVEAEFDLTLITRHRARGIQANANGRIVAGKCERLLEEYRALLSEGADLKQALGGPLRIGYYAPIAPAFLPAVLASFVPDASLVELTLEDCDNDTAQDGLLSGKYDAILFVSEDVRPAITYDILIKAPPYCLVPADHALASAPAVTMAQIAQEPLVVLNRPVAAEYYRRLFDGQGDGPSIAAYATSTEMVRSLVGAGHGCAVLNMRPQTSVSYAGESVVARPISDPLPPLTLSIGYDMTRPRRLVQRFVAACHAHFARDGQDQCIVR